LESDDVQDQSFPSLFGEMIVGGLIKKNSLLMKKGNLKLMWKGIPNHCSFICRPKLKRSSARKKLMWKPYNIVVGCWVVSFISCNRIFIIFKYLHSQFYCGCYLLFVYEIICVLNYYINIYTRLNNAVITICKLK
jgi:hypothetical protein